MNSLKTWTLMAALAGLLVFVGYAVGGSGLALLALGFATIMNATVYWTSDRLALRAAGARELRPGELPRVRSIVADLARRAGIPMPRLYVIERPEPNAFATGRDPDHAAVAVTTGLLEIMDDRQLAGVLAHELAHVKHRDTLVGTVAATIAGAISFIAQMLQFQLWFGGDDERPNPFAAIAAILLAPLAAMIIQLAVSRSREYGADAGGAELTRDPEGLAQALERLDAAARRPAFGLWSRRRADAAPAPNPAFAHLYIVNPLRGTDLASLFSTHPPIAERVARLRRRVARPG
jgi:heat shock protein HtpX